MNKQELNKMISFNKETNTIELNIPKDLKIDLKLMNDLKGGIKTRNVGGNIWTGNVGGNIWTDNVGSNIITRVVEGNIRTLNVVGNIWSDNVGGYIWTDIVGGNIITEGKSRINNKWYDNITKDGISTEYTKKRTINGLDIYHLIGSVYDFLIVDKTLNLSAHGDTLKECKESLKYKIENFKKDKKPIIDKIKKAGRLSREDYRRLTVACEKGVKEFCKENKITTKTISINKLLKIFKDKNYYGSEEFGKWFKESE